jgi:hypothetical protein
MKRQPDRIDGDRRDTMAAMDSNQRMVTRIKIDHPLQLKFEARGATGQQNPLITGLVIPESLGTRLAAGMDRLKSEGWPDEQLANFLLPLERGSLRDEVADNGFHGVD